jgi:imidazolonepropionase
MGVADWDNDETDPAGGSLLISNIGQLCTLAGDNTKPRRRSRMCELAIVRDGAVVVDTAGRIAYSGPVAGLPANLDEQVTHVIDAGGGCVTPGLVDSHTHLCFAGDRAGEFYRRCAGETYADIAKGGGGIALTCAATRAATQGELAEDIARRLERVWTNGTTTIEIKSGYGLTPEDELKQLRAVRQIADANGLDSVFSTYMGAHTVPPEYRDRRSDYVRQVVETIPQVAAEGLAQFVDIFVDPLAFSHEESLPIIEATRAAGLKLKLHGDEFNDDGTAAWGAQLGAVSIDHLGGISEAGIEALAGSATIATLLPGTMFFSAHGRFAPARKMIDAGCAVALATDLNPGSSHVYSLPFVMSLAALKMQMSAAECLVACTINAAHALAAAHEIGSLEVGKRADLVVWDCESYEQIPYYVGTSLARHVVIGGQIL